ncbi:hypothetical protein KUCAC02_028956, partial [Chaenocephalus aceratus]
EELEGYPDSSNSNKLDYSSQMTSFHAFLQLCRLGAVELGRLQQLGHSAAGRRPRATLLCQSIMLNKQDTELWFGDLRRNVKTIFGTSLSFILILFHASSFSCSLLIHHHPHTAPHTLRPSAPSLARYRYSLHWASALTLSS